MAKELLREGNDGRTYLAYRGKEGGDLVLENVVNGKEEHIRGNGFQLPVLDKGTCIVHEQFNPTDIDYLRKKDGIEIVMAHPEVSPGVAEVSDFVGGTGKMIDYVEKSSAKKFLVITECDLTAPLREAFPKDKYGKEFYTPCILCPYMKKNSIDVLLNSFRYERYEIHLDEKTAAGAKRSLDRMFELTRERK